jgi:hypothetical protein
MRHRIVTPELLDELPADDPEAIRSRRDLQRVNLFLGNERWICRTLRRFPEAATRGIVEIGAGEGHLTHRIAQLFPAAPVAACDLAPRPAALDPRVEWHRGDLLEKGIARQPGGVLVANLFLHHFEPPALEQIGRSANDFSLLLFTEPDRARLPDLLGYLAHPFINAVTRHDMHVSIRAGFAHAELPRLLGLSAGRWNLSETSTWRGARRVLAWRA